MKYCLWINKLLLTVVLFFPTIVLAEDYKPKPIKLNVPIGDLKEVTGLGQYIQTWYGFVIGMVGILASVMIMYAGLKWLMSRGNASVISDAKEKIWAAIIGMTIAFLSFIILNIINPKLLVIGLPDLGEGIEVDYGNRQGSPDNVPAGGVPLVAPNPKNEEAVRGKLDDTGIEVKPYPQTQVGGLTPTAIDGTIALVNACRSYAEESGSGKSCEKTTISGGSERAGHSATGGHPIGQAVDIRPNEGINDLFVNRILPSAELENPVGDPPRAPDPARGEAYPTYTTTFNGRPVTIIDERGRSGAAHWHIQFE